MKTKNIIAVLLISAVSAPCGIAQMRDVTTGNDLAKKFEKVHLNSPLNRLKKNELKGPDPSTVNQPVDILKSSDFLSFQGYATLVPKRAILAIPKRLKDRIRYVPGSKIITWSDFFAKNRGWIKTHEVTRTQAEGNEPFPEDVSDNLAKSSIVVVATFKGGPISVLPLKEPEPEAEEKKK